MIGFFDRDFIKTNIFRENYPKCYTWLSTAANQVIMGNWLVTANMKTPKRRLPPPVRLYNR